MILGRTIVRFALVDENSRRPTRGSEHAAGWDLYARERVEIAPGARALVGSGVRIAPCSPAHPDWEAQVRPRSGMTRRGLDVPIGTIDPGFRGEVGVIVVNNTGAPATIEIGDRIAQLVFSPLMRAYGREDPAADETKRGPGGFGSTGVR